MGSGVQPSSETVGQRPEAVLGLSATVFLEGSLHSRAEDMPSDMLELDRYLEQHRAEGVQCSEGSFSLSARKALEKFAQYQLEFPGLWLVKIVQCGVALGVEQISVALKKNTLEVTLPGDIGLTAQGLWDGVVTAPPLTPPQQHLVTGIRALYGQHNGLAWICQSAEGTSVLSLSGDTLSKSEMEQTGSEFKLIVERRNSGIGAGRWLSRSLDELQAVRRLCWLSPVPILLDGRTLAYNVDPVSTTLARWEVARRNEDGELLRVFRDCGGQTPSASGDKPVFFSKSPSRKFPYFQRWSGREAGFAPIPALLTLESGEGIKSQIRYVLDGALIEGPQLNLPLVPGLALRAYMPVKDLRVDLSQFQTNVRFSDTQDQGFRKQAREFFKSLIDQLEGSLGNKKTYDPQMKGAGATMATAATFLKSKALFLALGLPAGLLVGGGVATAVKMKDYNRRMQRLDLQNACRAGLRQLGH